MEPYWTLNLTMEPYQKSDICYNNRKRIKEKEKDWAGISRHLTSQWSRIGINQTSHYEFL